MITNNPKLSIIVPAYDEASVLKQNVALIDKIASQIVDSYEIIIAEDGGSYETNKITADIPNHLSNVSYLHSIHRLGKGLAVVRAVKIAKGEIILFMDADLSTSLIHMNDVVKLIENDYDVVLGSRHVKGASVKRPISREIASRAYNVIVNLLFWDRVSDHQCGFKGFRRESINGVFEEIKENGFIFDTELIIRIKKHGLRIIEIPVKWKEPENRLAKFDLFSDGMKMGFDLIKLRFKLRDA